MQDVLDRFDPLSPDFGARSRRSAAPDGARRQERSPSLLPGWDATYTGPDGVLHDLHGLAVGPQIGQSVRQVIDGTRSGR